MSHKPKNFRDAIDELEAHAGSSGSRASASSSRPDSDHADHAEHGHHSDHGDDHDNRAQTAGDDCARAHHDDSQAHGPQARLEREIRRMEELLKGMKPHLDDLGGKVGTEAQRARRRIEQRVVRNPLGALGIAALIGLVLGLILGKRRRD